MREHPEGLIKWAKGFKSFMNGGDERLDDALVYAMISFLAVILLSKVYLGIYRERKHEEELLAVKAQEEGGAGK